LPLQNFLKRSVYIPARKGGCSRSSAAVLTFVASGLMHEYSFSIHNSAVYEPGKALVFFVLMGVMVLMEDYWLAATPDAFKQWAQRIPSPIIASTLLLLAAGPFELWFVRSWLEAGAMEAVAEMLPHVTCT
jgi:hypothetical protein